VVSSQGSVEEIRQALYDHINNSIKDFRQYYSDFMLPAIEIDTHNAISSLESLLSAVRSSGYKLYLLIDEYDNFANEIMMGRRDVDSERYKTLLYGEGSVKTLFKTIKSGATGRGLDRVFITGVSPVVLSDITSGYNVAENIYLKQQLNDLCGFHEREIKKILTAIIEECGLATTKVEEALRLMRTFYNGYSFSYEGDNLIYNPTMALYFIKIFQEECGYPRKILDSNLAMDRGKIAYIAHLPKGKEVILAALSNENLLSIPELADRFGIEDMLYETKDNTFMASLLYYFGVLTMDGDTEYGDKIMRIPNLVVKKLYAEEIRDNLLPERDDRNEADRVTRLLYQKGDISELCAFIEKRFNIFDNRDYRWSNELTVKTAFLILLFNDTFYIMDSEAELGRHYADLTMIVRPDMRKYKLLDILIEFKYVGLKELNLSGESVKNMAVEDLLALALVQEKLEQSKIKIEKYTREVQAKYNNILRLHRFSVVSIGFERLVWKKVEVN
jgi:hypothetical protein